jgi:hypothetical protein
LSRRLRASRAKSLRLKLDLVPSLFFYTSSTGRRLVTFKKV